MQRACRVAMVGWFLLAACAKEHSESARSPNEPEPRDSGATEAEAGASGAAGTGLAGEPGPARAGKGGSSERPQPPAADGGKAEPGTTATAVLAPTDAHAAESGEGAIRGTAKFRQGTSSVDLSIQIRGCARTTTSYLVFVQEGSDCSEKTLLGPRWDSPRGEGIAGVQCIGTAGNGRVTYSRPNESDGPWTIGGPARTNLIGYVIAIYDPDSLAPLACGVIERDVRAPSTEPPPPTAPVERAAPIAGLCLAGMIVRDSEHACPDPNEIVKCANAHCDVNACAQKCSSYLDCLGESEDPCSRQFVCDIDEPCSQCYSEIQSCSLTFCADVYACAAPASPDGPCSKLEACCALQGDQAPMCLELIQTVKKFSGDPSCIGLMQDWDFFSHLTVPCEFE